MRRRKKYLIWYEHYEMWEGLFCAWRFWEDRQGAFNWFMALLKMLDTVSSKVLIPVDLTWTLEKEQGSFRITGTVQIVEVEVR